MQCFKYNLDTGAPLSEQQLNIYLDITMNEKIESYLMPVVINLEQKYSIDDIKKALNKVIRAYPILSSYIGSSDNTPYIYKGKKAVVNTASQLSDDKIKEFLTKPFNINEHLSRFLINTDKDNNIILLSVFHHIIFDGLSVDVFREQVKKALERKQISQDTTFLKVSAFSEEIKKTEVYKDAERFYEKEFCDSENIVELLDDIGDNKPSYTELKLNVDNKWLLIRMCGGKLSLFPVKY